jgi:hypothetical protein
VTFFIRPKHLLLLVVGENPHEEEVSKLKDTIQVEEPNYFADIGADKLELWKVDISSKKKMKN